MIEATTQTVEAAAEQPMYHLPAVDYVWRNQHLLDEPVMLYPGEKLSPPINKGKSAYYITNYARVINANRKTFVKTISGVQTQKYMREHFEPADLDNEYTRTNLYNTPDKVKYRENREQRIERQKAYNRLHTQHKKEYDRERKLKQD